MKALFLEEIIDPLPILLPKVKTLISLLNSSKSPLIFTGAGISTSSGIPDYRSSYKTSLKTGPGVWEKAANRDKFKGIPIIKPAIECYPTKTHMALKKLLEKGRISHILTQNVDNLHLRSGIREENLTELHGNICKEICENCDKGFYRDFYVKKKDSDPLEVYTGRICDICKGKLRKSIVNFGEKINEENLRKSQEITEKSDFCLCLDSSFRVNPAAKFPKRFARKKLVIVNLQRNLLENIANLTIYGFCDEIMEVFMKEIGEEIEEFKVRKAFLIEFYQDKQGVFLKISGKIPGFIDKEFDNIQEIEVFDKENNEFFIRKDGDLAISLYRNVRNLRIIVKFFGNLMEPNAIIEVDLLKESFTNDTLKLFFSCILSDFFPEWEISRFSLI